MSKFSKKNIFILFGLLLFILMPLHQINAQEEKGADNEKSKKQHSIEELIQKLDAEEYTAREKATKRLISIGESAIPYLVKHVDTESLELRHRIQMILKELKDEILLYFEEHRDELPARRKRAIENVVRSTYGNKITGLLEKHANMRDQNLYWTFSPPAEWSRSLENVQYRFAFGFNTRFSMRMIICTPKKNQNNVEVVQVLMKGASMTSRRTPVDIKQYHRDPVTSISIKKGVLSNRHWKVTLRTVYSLLKGKAELKAKQQPAIGVGGGGQADVFLIHEFLRDGEMVNQRTYSGLYRKSEKFCKLKVAGNIIQTMLDRNEFNTVSLPKKEQQTVLNWIRSRTNDGKKGSWSAMRYLALTRICQKNKRQAIGLLKPILKRKLKKEKKNKRLVIHCLAELTGKDFRPPAGQKIRAREVADKYLKYLEDRSEGKEKENMEQQEEDSIK